MNNGQSISELLKTCSNCKIEKSFQEFSKSRSRKDGHDNQCKSCKREYRQRNKEKIAERNKEYQKEYYKQNKEKIAERSKEYREQNKEKIAEQRRKYQQENKEKIKEYLKEYCEKNKEKKAEYDKQYEKQNKERLSKRRKEYRNKNKENIAKRTKEYEELNKDKIAKRKKEYCQQNKDKFAARTAKRRARKLRATPPWLTQSHIEQIEELYTICKLFQMYTGLIYHVDHIVPLQGKTVCGLHVPWNLQVLEASENRSKNNRLLENL